MKKIIIAIFAHPDDEAFGPSGTLLSEVSAGAELHLVCLTDGSGGTNQDNHADLGAVRLREWRAAGAILGATSQHHLGMIDGRLSNTDFLEATEQIKAIIHAIAQEQSQPYIIELLSNDLNGITGHIDHIVAARVTCYLFYTLRTSSLPVRRLRLSCIPASHLDRVNTDWLYMEPGRTPEEINEVVDARTWREEIIAVMHAHYSQRADSDAHIAKLGDVLGLNYFITIE